MASLYEINKQIEDLLESLYEDIDEETGEVNDDSAEKLMALNMARDEKLDNIGCYIKSPVAEVAAMKNEVKNLKERIERKENKLERLENLVKEDLIAHGENKKESARVVYSFRSSKSVNITDEKLLPEKYLTVKTTTAPNKTEIKSAIQAGEEVPGAEIVESKNLQIK